MSPLVNLLCIRLRWGWFQSFLLQVRNNKEKIQYGTVVLIINLQIYTRIRSENRVEFKYDQMYFDFPQEPL